MKNVILFYISISVIAPLAHATGKMRMRGEAIIAISEDFKSHKSEVHFLLKDKKTKKFRKVKFKNNTAPRWFKTETEVDITGDLDETEALIVDTGSTVTSTTSTVNVLYQTDKRPTLILQVNMTDGSSYLSQSTLAQYMYAPTLSVAHFYLDSTAGKMTFDGDPGRDGQLDIHAVHINSTVGPSCSYSTWGTLADQEAEKLGINLSQYKHVVYVLPSGTSSCGWHGLAYVGGSRSWLRQGGVGVFAHELGHNLGMHHSGTDPENDGSLNSEYGDGSCVMGNAAGLPYTNAPHMHQLGVFNAVPEKVIDGKAGSYDISALEIDPTISLYPQIVRLEKSNTNEVYYLSLRRNLGYDKNISSAYSRGVSIHRASTSGAGKTAFIRTLAPGETFNDTANGIEIRANSFSSDMNAINIFINAPVSTPVACSTGQPTLTLSSNKVTTRTGTETQINWTLKNNDNVSCPDTQFSLSASAVNGISSRFSPSVIRLPAGAAQSGTLTLSSVNANDGSWSLNLAVKDTDGLTPNHNDISGAINVIVDNKPPSSVSKLKVSVNKTNVSLSWTAAKDVGSGIALYEIKRNGVKVGTSATTSFSQSSVASGTYQYEVIAIDLVGNRSSSSGIRVTVSGTTSKSSGSKRNRR